jgi:hydroxymethylglutaryl-CoA lyase
MSGAVADVAGRARITEVGPRDGLQSLDRFVPTADKIRMINLLTRAGLQSIEVTSFVRPDVVPNLADAERVMRGIDRLGGVEYRALVPNSRGAERAIEAGASTLVALITASDGYARRHQNRPVHELLEITVAVLALGRKAGVPVEVAVAMAFFDPYRGDTPPDEVEALFERLIDAGAERFYVAGSTGVETPLDVRRLLRRLRARWPELDLGLHLHNTNGLASALALVGLEEGVTRFESSICGIGGGIALPAGGPPVGNIATEDLLALLDGLGIETGLDAAQVTACAREVATLLGIEPRSRAAVGGTKVDLLERGRAQGAQVDRRGS